ncbi:MAG: hypothetical protein MSR67_06075 [Oscillospiraceae bacterium]|nr:hypothetical protein [Oscillospiraceae bacterium]
MFKFLSASNAEMTRYVKLENCETGKVEMCFDDSDLRHENQIGFEFMQVGSVYDCKILLFGIAIDLSDEEAIEQSRILCKTSERELLVCETVDENCFVGNRKLLQVISGGNIYYVDINDAAALNDCRRFVFRFSRKDLIQVDDVVHPSFL